MEVKKLENRELARVICGLVREIAEKEKKKAINTDDYGIAFIAASVEGISRDVESAIN